MAKLSDYKVLTFDCYGTIELLAVYHECEAAQQAETPDLPYDKVLTRRPPKVAARLGLKKPRAQKKKARPFGASVGKWPAFPDSVAALSRLSRHYKLVILSNVDRESIVGSYKPDIRNFEYMVRQVKDRFGAEKDQIIQTAQSQFHDHQPAKKTGIKSSWIVRPGAVMGNRMDEIYDWKFETLGDMADAVEEDASRN
ncbi:hypothetical protein J3459_016768 [Metarhizium acridum]|nr:hypothetical protein J3459_016768 [Metarhizium acridum]